MARGWGRGANAGPGGGRGAAGGRRGRGRGGAGHNSGIRGQIIIGEELKIAVNLALKNFRENSEETELSLPSSLLSTERAYVHKLAIEMGLQSKSRGKGQSRYITIFKKEKSTIIARNAELDLTEESQRVIYSLLSRYPLTSKDKSDTLSGVTGVDSKNVRPVLGRLGGGVAQVPGPVSSTEYLAARKDLPIWSHRQQLVEAVSGHQVVLVTGDTGSGKTTQLVQYLLEEAGHNGHNVRMVCCQPRRLTAVTVAERIATERGEKLGGTIGYQIRLESCVSTKTLATFCTYGVLLRSLCGGLEMLESLTHIIIDEIHERDSMSDFLMTVLRDALSKYRHLKLVLMSATVDTQLFLNYFPGCVHVGLEGKMFPVEEFYLEHILSMTDYKTKAMEKLEKSGLTNRSATTIEDLANKLSNTVSVSGDIKEDEDDVVIEEEPDEKVIVPDMDKILEDCFRTGSEEHFQKLTERLSEGVESLVNYRHSLTGVSCLMAGASHGNVEMVDMCLQLGADIGYKLTNGWTALDIVRMKEGQEECEKLLMEYQQLQGMATQTTKAQVSSNMKPQEKERLDLYYGSVDNDLIDHDLVIKLLVKIHQTQSPGAVLVFLPGYEDISILYDMILGDPNLNQDSSVFILHSQIGSSESKKAFQTASAGYRKIVLATNIAETGVTIPDIVYVIDTGKVKMKSFDSLTNTSMLKSDWISQTSATQRKGRAGRCQPGKVFRLFSSTMHANMQEFTTPEILRTSLLSLCLQSKLLAPPNTPIADFLARVPDPPPFLITRNAVQSLKTMEALDIYEEITPLGLHLLDIPMDPGLGKILLHSVMLKCLDPVLTITCMLAYRSPFLLSVDPVAMKAGDTAKKRLSHNTASDHMAMLKAFQEWQHARLDGREKRWCKQNYVASSTMEMVVGMRNQVLAQLRASGFVKSRGNGDIRNININSDNWPLVKACFVPGLYPNIVRVDQGSLRSQRENKIKVGPGCVLRNNEIKYLNTDWLVFEEMSRVGRTAYIKGVTPVSPMTIALFGGSGKTIRDEGLSGNMYLEETSDSETEEMESSHSLVMVDSWIVFSARQNVGTMVTQLRHKWSSLWNRRMLNTSKHNKVGMDEQEEMIIAAISDLLRLEDQALGLQQPPGIGQRPRQLSVDLTTGQPNHGPTSVRRKMSASSVSTDTSLIKSIPPSGVTRFFIVRPSTGSINALEAAMSYQSGVWSFPHMTERKLLSATANGDKVVAIFSVQNSGAVQGVGLFTGEQLTQGGRSGVLMEWWVTRQPVMLSCLQVRLEASRDGQELDPLTGQAVLNNLGINPSQPLHHPNRRLDKGFYR